MCTDGNHPPFNNSNNNSMAASSETGAAVVAAGESAASLAPERATRMQALPSRDEPWEEALRRIMALTADGSRRFASQPWANRIGAILEAVVPPRTNPTHEKVLTVVNALLETSAIRPDEAGMVYDALLERVSRYNSGNVQTNLDRLSQDVRQVISQRERSSANNLGSLAALNAFIASLPATVERGQESYLGFLSALRLLVSEVPQTEVFRTGPHTFLQAARNGSKTVNLNQAMENLRPLWGLQAPAGERGHVSSLLTPNTRLLLLLVAPFAEEMNVSRSSYIGHLLTLYRETLANLHVDERTYQEITSVSRALGDEDDAARLQATLNFLLTNRRRRLPAEFALTAEEERILRYVQQAVSLYLMQDGATATGALDETSRNLEPSFYAAHRGFINRLMDYFHRAAAVAPNYFMNAVLNPRWLPSEGFFTGVYDFPEQDEGEERPWDNFDSDEEGRLMLRAASAGSPESSFTPLPRPLVEEPPSRAASTPALSRASSRAPSLLSLASLGKREGGDSLAFSAAAGPASAYGSRWGSRRSSLASGADSLEWDALLAPPKDVNEHPAMTARRRRRASRSSLEDDIDAISSQLYTWRTRAQEMGLPVASFSRRHQPRPGALDDDDEEEEDWRQDRFLRFEAPEQNPFRHLAPKGL